jgi:hypothetical protein
MVDSDMGHRIALGLRVLGRVFLNSPNF